MLEKRLYKFDEIADYLGTRNNQGLRNKLQRYGVKFQEEGRGRMKTFNILSIPDPFPLYCVFDLGIDYRTDFKKLRDFTFFLLRDDDFSGRSGEMMEEYLHNGGYQISRQTIAKYIALYERMDLIATNGETVYYRVYHEGLLQKHEVITKELYCKAWSVYWKKRRKNADSLLAFRCMYNFLDGVPRKQNKIVKNGFYTDTLNSLSELVAESFLNEKAE
ncbi:hypothetical protein [Ruminococcus sp.]|uniref:hypothetical protein n=1 Tax=Ruminococcus sp. TaxID=41978 RepID=UPI002E78F341|nr:hypothetical protein [Ruminococcus sp.]MEE1263150.1 hypothetical protein [Ruminococcus sp.]